MPEGPFGSATRDPIALLEQLIAQVAGVRADLTAFRTEMTEFKTDMLAFKDEMAQFRGEVRDGFRHLHTGLSRFAAKADEDNRALRTQLENHVDRQTYFLEQRLRQELQDRYDLLDVRVSRLEAAERQRQREKGA